MNLRNAAVAASFSLYAIAVLAFPSDVSLNRKGSILRAWKGEAQPIVLREHKGDSLRVASPLAVIATQAMGTAALRPADTMAVQKPEVLVDPFKADIFPSINPESDFQSQNAPPMDCKGRIIKDFKLLSNNTDLPAFDSSVIEAFSAAQAALESSESKTISGQTADIIRRYADKIVVPEAYKNCTNEVRAMLQGLVEPELPAPENVPRKLGSSPILNGTDFITGRGLY